MFWPLREWGHDGWVLNPPPPHTPASGPFDPKWVTLKLGWTHPASTFADPSSTWRDTTGFPLGFPLASLWTQCFSDGDNMEAEAAALQFEMVSVVPSGGRTRRRRREVLSHGTRRYNSKGNLKVNRRTSRWKPWGQTVCKTRLCETPRTENVFIYEVY